MRSWFLEKMSADPTSLVVEDLDCNSFFGHIEDLLDFPEVNNKNSHNAPLVAPGLAWNAPPYSFFNPDLLFIGKGSACTQDLAAELSIPYEDIVQMEWLSTFVEDSFSGGDSMTLDKKSFPSTKEASADAAVAPVQFLSSSPISVLESSSSSSCSEGSKALLVSPDSARVRGGCGRPRSKRPRPHTFKPGSAMQLISPAQSFTDTPQLSASHGAFQGNKFKQSPHLTTEQNKKRKMKPSSSPATPAAEMSNNETGAADPQSQAGVRKCLHCEITKTPQWRAGPMGPKTLCNACGVRHKSGRLFPEYRPAASPTFVPSLHSNSHKKVLEMRTATVHTPATTPPGGKMGSDTHPELIPNEKAILEYM
uniref:GATA transcription factor n=2 Tax=Kalanchoe fedtschenkoi TaxID=63787 RepID=A0A7N0V5Y7_KALFE